MYGQLQLEFRHVMKSEIGNLNVTETVLRYILNNIFMAWACVDGMIDCC